MAAKSTKEVREIVKRYYTLLIRAGFPLEKVILFGSKTRNEQNENSDIDIAVVLKKYSKDRFTTRLELMKFSREFDEIIEPHPFLSTELDGSDPFISEIIDNGIEVHI